MSTLTPKRIRYARMRVEKALQTLEATALQAQRAAVRSQMARRAETQARVDLQAARDELWATESGA